jgi:hypothetical protein
MREITMKIDDETAEHIERLMKNYEATFGWFADFSVVYKTPGKYYGEPVQLDCTQRFNAHYLSMKPAEPEYPRFRLGDCVEWQTHKGVVEEAASVLVRWQDGAGKQRVNILELKRRDCESVDRP